MVSTYARNVRFGSTKAAVGDCAWNVRRRDDSGSNPAEPPAILRATGKRDSKRS